jgi:diguanylate cyclase (GGDEF)-like protein/PAS domain S-box-containing protein
VPESLELVRKMMQKKLGGGLGTTYEVTMLAKDGRGVILELSARLLFQMGEPVGLLGIARDLSKRERSEPLLGLLKSVVVNANDSVLIAEATPGDPLGAKIVYVNDAFSRMTGYPPDEAIGRTPRILMGPRTDRQQLDQVRKALVNWVPIRVEMINYRRDGLHYWADVNFVPIADDHGEFKHWVAVQRETTHRKRAEDLERDRNQVLELVAKNKPLESILAHLAQMVERQCPETLCSVLLSRNGRLCPVAGLSLPRGYIQEVDGSSRAAGNRANTGVVSDTTSDSLRKGHRELSFGSNLRPYWSVPIHSGSAATLAAFAVHCHRPRPPSDAELDLLDKASRLAAIAIEQRQLTDQLAHQAQHDALTGLPNRVFFADRLQQALAQARPHGSLVAVLFVDLDRFKQINDTLGHSVGDSLLQQVARRLEGCVRQTDTLARMGGDEFTLLLTELKDQQYALLVSQKLLDALKAPFHVDGYELFVTASIGISLYPRDGRDAATLQRNADSAMYRAKNQGKNNFQLFMPEISATALELLEMENALRKALEHGELQIHYQPQVDVNGKLAALEALLVWNHPKLGIIPPSQFIPVAEESGLIFPIGSWVLRQACQQNAAWQKAGYPVVKVGVNVSAMQFTREGFVDTVAQVLAQTGLDPSLLELELTESLVMRDIQESSHQMDRLRALGVSLSMDDFGTGYSSLSYLQRFPLDTLKIDQSFLREIDSAPSAMPLVKAIVALAHSLMLCVVAEGVENQRQLEALRRVGCDRFQGYLLGEPLPVEPTGRLLSHPQGLVEFQVPDLMAPQRRRIIDRLLAPSSGLDLN